MENLRRCLLLKLLHRYSKNSFRNSHFLFLIRVSSVLAIIDSQVPINPYGKAKKMAEDMILDFSKNSDMAVMILRSVPCFLKPYSI